MSDQEEFWRGEFGDEYTKRVQGEGLVVNNMRFFCRILERTEYLIHNRYYKPSVIEFGAGSGLNLKALQQLGFDVSRMAAVEINSSACDELRKIDGLRVYEGSMFETCDFGQWDMVLSSGLLIHIGPEDLSEAYQILYNACKPGGTIVLVEYFAATPTPVMYRGNEGKLWRRNYGKDMLERFGDLSLLSYDFVADIDPICPRDNVTTWCLKKK